MDQQLSRIELWLKKHWQSVLILLCFFGTINNADRIDQQDMQNLTSVSALKMQYKEDFRRLERLENRLDMVSGCLQWGKRDEPIRIHETFERQVQADRELK